MSDILPIDTIQNPNPTIINTKKYSVKLKEFEGPLDLLLHLVKTSEVNIYDIPIADITHQYMEYLNYLVELDLDNISEFVEMAATLVLIKSKMMLPINLEFENDEEDPREELISKLLEYQKYKIAAGILDAKSEEANIEFVKKNTQGVLFDINGDESNWRPLSVIDLIGAFAKILNDKPSEASIEFAFFEYTVEDKIDLIKSLLNDKESFNYFDLLDQNMQKLELICIFLALLELVKQGYIAVRQHIIFGDIHIVRKEIIPSPVIN